MGIMNAMFSLSQTDNVKCGDSFITNVSPHLDVSVHNVPFGKSMKCAILKDNYKMETGLPPFDEVVPIQKNGDAMLATQVAVYKTRKMGVVIIKDGEETSGTSNKKWRQWMCDACVIHKIMKIPTGAFSHTGTKTVCIYFTKHEGQTTKSIQFLELSDSGEQITEICTVSRQDLEDNNYLWDPNAYIVDETMEKMMASSNCEWKKLGDVCEIKSGKQLSKKHFKEGPYPVIGGGQTPTGYHSEYNKEAHTILCSQSGSAGFISRYSTPIWASDCFGICAFEEITNDFLYYYLKSIQHGIYKLQSGAGPPHVYSRDIQNLDIPIPTQLIQTEVVSKLDDLAQQRQNLTDLCGGVERRMKYYFEMMIKKHRGEIVMEKLGDVCEIKSGDRITKKIEHTPTGQYRVYGGGNCSECFKVDKYNRDGKTCKISRFAASVHNCVLLLNGKYFLNDSGLTLESSRGNLTQQYIAYFFDNRMKNNKDLFKILYRGGGQQNLDMIQFKNLDIPIPTQLIQTEIVNYLDALEAERQSCTKQAEDIDKMMREILVQSYQDTSIVSQDAPTIANVATAMSQSVAHDHDAIMDDVQTAITDSLQNAIVSLPCATEPFAKVRRLDDDETPLPTATIDDVRCATAAC
jgi:restriction endonuclease S subunit